MPSDSPIPRNFYRDTAPPKDLLVRSLGFVKPSPPTSESDSDSDPDGSKYGIVSAIEGQPVVWIKRPDPTLSMSSGANRRRLTDNLRRPTKPPSEEVFYITWEIIDRLFSGVETISRDVFELKNAVRTANENYQSLATDVRSLHATGIEVIFFGLNEFSDFQKANTFFSPIPI